MIVNGTAKWAKVLAPGTGGKYAPAYEIDVYLDSKEVSRLEKTIQGYVDNGRTGSNSFRIRTDKETGDSFIKLKRKVDRNDGSPNKAPSVVNAANEPWDRSTMIGNGTKVNVSFSLYEWGTDGFSAELQGVQVLELVEYEGNAVEAFEAVCDGDEIPF